ncbi:patatin-like phospholipase family protein [Bosea sp. (in: a-proteobacteria)]|jgi:predicted acylesterase/phospholipase RssA|uniref:patatin-like phospholipase family protein n=1 Tax=Bosea sp. (in: a-proteobacteria) TaxID=1871050 RepID=UPI002DDD81F0|nr:patatin-like phospholipase family protein [Bosea sp. (in: a-proteobacteria)]HEV2510913.1 patatin-like phospholipase family protein [Bosea sp. (in: a-proteobacteria)]
MFAGLAYAGGGNRCYWQGGFYETVAPEIGLKPRRIVGASAGAGAMLYNALGVGPTVREMLREACTGRTSEVDWAAFRRGGRLFPVAQMYRGMLASLFTPERLAALKAQADFLIAISRPPRFWPLPVITTIGIGAYQLEKRLRRPVHPTIGRKLGFRPDLIRIADCADPEALVDALMASAAVPPFMPAGNIGARAALDGGLVDSAPAWALAEMEAAGEQTLVLLTRPFAQVPQVQNRTYVRPSQVIPVSQFTIRNWDGIRFAYELGVRDGENFLRTMERRKAG